MAVLNDSVHAFTQLISSPASSSSGPLKGQTFAVKEVFDIKGMRLQAGNPDYFSQAKPAEKTATAVSLLQEAGATLIAKTHTDELGGSLFGLNDHYGPPLNSQSPDRVPGGSSSGSAAAVAANLVDFALGADTSGSVRAPASFCGIYGLRPTLGSISTEGVLPISLALDTVGIFARSPATLSKILHVYGMAPHHSVKRLRPISSLLESLRPSLHNAFKKHLESLSPFASNTPPLHLSLEMLQEWRSTVRIIAMYGIWQVHKEWILSSNPKFGELLQDRFNLAQKVTTEEYREALKKQEQMKKQMENLLEPGDIAVFPTLHEIPPLLSTPIEDLKAYALEAACHTCIAALSGFPELTSPLKNVEGQCSLGMSFLGRPGDELTLTHLAEQIYIASSRNGRSPKVA